LRHDAFDVLTPDALYWCGFLFADGSIARSRQRAPSVALVLSERDLGHVEKFRTFLGSSHAITRFPRQAGSFNGRPVCRFSVRSTRLVERLEELGMVGGAVSPALADSHHFWRGVVDGDGYIGISGGHAQFKLVGTAWLLEYFRAFLVAEGVTGRISVRPHKGIYVVGSSWGGAERIIRRLYGDAPTSLARKANAARNIEALAAGSAVDSTRSHLMVARPGRSRMREPVGEPRMSAATETFPPFSGKGRQGIDMPTDKALLEGVATPR
jgi:hypothetical protein